MNRILTIVIFTLILGSCKTITGSGHIKTEERSTGSFDGIESTGSIDIEVKNGPGQMVEIEGDDNILPYVVAKVSNGLLKIGYKSHLSFVDSHVKAYVTTPTLKRIHVSGSADITARDTLRDENEIELHVGGSGDIKAILHSPSISANVSGSGSIVLIGKARNFKVTVSGSGDVKCRDLLSENTIVRVSGSGSAHVFASVKLDADVSGSGHIYYSGNPSSPSINKSGSGSVQAEK